LPSQNLEAAFSQLVKDQEHLIGKVCRIYAYSATDREDLYQEIVLQLWKSYPKFRGESKISTWVYRVGINTAISGIRKKRVFISSYEPAQLSSIAEETSSSQNDQLEELYRAIEHLNAVEKAIVMLYLEEKTYEEMEEVMGISNATLRVKMNRIREKLRQLTKTTSHGA
jgi:RNA polymerase sigma-70 factor, ECF subfamily